MDPNACLKDARELIALSNTAKDKEERARFRRMALDRFFDLDNWLSKGGFLPDDWSNKNG